MPRPHVAFPTPGKRRRRRCWQVFWRVADGFFSCSIEAPTEQDAEVRRLEVALALRTGQWPAWAKGQPAVCRWLARTFGPTCDLLAAYETHLGGAVCESWKGTCLAHLRELKAVTAKEFAELDPRDAQAYLDHIITTPGPRLKGKGKRTAATRNRALSVCSRFYGWALRTGRCAFNPFAGIARLREAQPAEIEHFADKERRALLTAADAEPEGLALYLSIYAGLRRGEIARARWADVDLPRRRLTVPRSKTGRPRIVPLANVLTERLKAIPESARKGGLLAWPPTEPRWRWASRELLRRIGERCPDLVPRLGWNALRHTFASTLAQAGVSLDKISAWMGNSPAVCRRHYAAFIPRDRYDADIDRQT